MKSATLVLALLITSWITPSFAYDPAPRARGTTVLNVKNYGAKGDGVTDDTAAIKRAIAALPSTGGTVQVPNGTYLVDATKNISLRSKMHLQLSSGATIKAKPNNWSRFYIINIPNRSDVEVSGGTIIGERYAHRATDGEWGNGIYVSGSRRVTIRNLTVKDNWGDGISVVGTLEEPFIFSEDVIIDNVISTNNRRQGMSIGKAINVKVYDSEFSYTNGTPPAYGIDVEPEYRVEGSFASDILIDSCKFHHNAGGGIQLYKQVSEVRILRNEITYNPYGMYIVGTGNGVIWGNKFSHNIYLAIAVRRLTNAFDIYQNAFRNNMTYDYGYTGTTNPFKALFGLVPGTEDHIGVVPEATDIYIGKNYYAP